MGITNSNKLVSADRIDCDGSLRVTLALTAAPDIVTNPTDIALVLDRSGSMTGEPMANMKLGAKTFIDIISEATGGSADGQIGSGSRIGVVSFADTAVANTQLITSVDALKNAVDALAAMGNTNHADAFSKATGLFDDASSNARVIVMMGFTQQAMETERKQVQLELSRAKARDRELDTLFEKLHEDNVAGKISDERFVRMSKKYEAEQAELRSSIKALQANIERIDGKAATADMFISAVRKYTRVRKLTPRMLNELIDKIEVHQAEKVNGVWRQRLTIHYNCVGAINLPDTATIQAPHVTMNTRQGVYVTYEPDTPAPAADTVSA